MKRVRLLHWKAEEGAAMADALRSAGFDVEYDAKFAPAIMRAMRERPPDAVAIDLSKLPSHGREIAIAMRGNQKTRHIPIIFVGGAADKVSIVREKLPDAGYCERDNMVAAIRKAMKQRVDNPLVPMQMMERYATRTTAQKLGICANAKVAVIDAPRDYARVIGKAPENVEFDEGSWEDCAVTVWFVEEPEALLAALPRMRRAATKSKLWVAWPKKAARKDSLLNETLIREMAIESGLTDYKVCSLNDTWSGLCFALKKAR
jgi:CheY-like chemotaxis protein